MGIINFMYMLFNLLFLRQQLIIFSDLNRIEYLE